MHQPSTIKKKPKNKTHPSPHLSIPSIPSSLSIPAIHIVVFDHGELQKLLYVPEGMGSMCSVFRCSVVPAVNMFVSLTVM